MFKKKVAKSEKTKDEKVGVLLMGHGSPAHSRDAGIFLHNMFGKPPRKVYAAALAEKYEAIGGVSPFNAIALRQKRGLQKLLAREHGVMVKVYLAMKYWHPYVSETLERMRKDGVRHIVALPLSPFYSTTNTEKYRSILFENIKNTGEEWEVDFIDRWHTNPFFLQCLLAQIQEGLRPFKKGGGNIFVVFTAHSLPEKVKGRKDPYKEELMKTSRFLAKESGIRHWSLAFQSVPIGEKSWLGPSVEEAMEEAKKQGFRNVLLVPLGFTSDNLEILYDIDIVCQSLAQKLGLRLERVHSRNTHPLFLRALQSAVSDFL